MDGSKDKYNVFHNLTDFKVYRADDKDVSYMRDFTRYADYTNSLIFKEAKKKPRYMNNFSMNSHDTFKDLSEEH